MLMLIIGICFLLMAVTFYLKDRCWYAPCVLVNAMWGLLMVAYPIAVGDLLPINGRFPILICIWVCGFSLAAAIFEEIIPAGKPTSHGICFPTAIPIGAVAAMASILAGISIVQFALNYPGNFFMTLRVANTGQDFNMVRYMPELGILPYFTSAVLPLFLSLLSESDEHKKSKPYKAFFILTFILCIFNAILGMGKMVFLSLFFSAIIILSRKHRIKLSKLIISTVAVLGVVIFIQITRTKALGETFDLRIFLDTYLLSGIAAFDNTDIPVTHQGTNSFRLIYAVAASLGADISISDTILPFTMAGPEISTNVYTTLYPFYADFGTWGVTVFSILTGAICGTVYKLSSTKQSAFILYSIIAPYVVLQFFAELIFTNASLNIQYLIYIFLIYLPIDIKLLHRNG